MFASIRRWLGVKPEQPVAGTGWAKRLLEIQRVPQPWPTGVVVDKVETAMSTRLILKMPPDYFGIQRIIELSTHSSLYDPVKIGDEVAFRNDGSTRLPEFVGIKAKLVLPKGGSVTAPPKNPQGKKAWGGVAYLHS